MQPLEYIRGLLGEEVDVVLRDSSKICGTLHMFDEHVNLVLGDLSGPSLPKDSVMFLRSENILLIAEVSERHK
jgi:small nuclear ribonucleoprotein (snRNP)-like protein